MIFDLTTRHLETGKAIPLSGIRQLSPRLAVAYHQKTDKTIRRDINELIAMDLLEETRGGLRPKIEKMLAFMSPALAAEDDVQGVRGNTGRG